MMLTKDQMMTAGLIVVALAVLVAVAVFAPEQAGGPAAGNPTAM